jgi:hypothetical protein
MGRRVLWVVLLFTSPALVQAQGLQPPVLELIDRETPPRPIEGIPPKAMPNLDVKVSPNTGMPRLGAPQEPAPPATLVEAALHSTDWIDPRYIENSQHPDDLGLWVRNRVACGEQIHRLVEDYKNFYCTSDVLCLGVAVAIAAPLANTHADVGIRNWYQAQAGQSSGATRTADVFKAFGEYQYAIPIYLVLSFGGNLWPDSPFAGPLGEFGNRSLRALAVGAPAVGILQVGLGSDRPGTDNSHWQPFRYSHGVSGHAFVGAVPFLTAAEMTDSYALKALLIAASVGPAWSRIHTDDHYFSQAFLGWSIACLSVHAVNQTESRFRVVPVELPNGVGMGLEVHY